VSAGRGRTAPDPAPPFFIVGSARSGTTLLHSMLDCHSEVAIPPETHLVGRSLRPARPCIRNGRVADWEGFAAAVRANPSMAPLMEFLPAEPPPEPPSLRGVLDGVFAGYARSRGNRRWGEKTPHHLWFWRDLDAIFTDARYLVVARDGRDVACSLSEVEWSSGDPLVNAARWKVEWRKAIRLLEEAGERAHRVFYEDLVAEPEPVLRGVCAFLGLDFEPALLEGFAGNRDVIHDRERDWKARNLTALTAESVGRHRRDLSPHLVRRLDCLLERELRESGRYAIDSRPLGAAAALLLKARAMAGLARELAGKRRRGRRG